MAAAKKTLSVEAQTLQAVSALLSEPGAKPLLATKTQPGIFTGTKAKTDPLAKLALEQAWLEPTGDFLETGTGKKKTRLELYRLTPKGVAAIVDQGDTQQVLATLAQAVTQLAEQSSHTKLNVEQQAAHVTIAVRQALERVVEQCTLATGQVQEELHSFQVRMTAHESATQPLQQAFAQLAAKLKPLDVDELARKMAGAAPTPPSRPVVSDAAGWLDEAVRLVGAHKQRNAFLPLNLTQLYQQLCSSHPQLSLGQYHDGLRRLHREHRLRLTPFTASLATLDDPQYALYLDHEVKYYVEPAQ